MKKLKHFKGFTLVELIIVITILSILATIAFISFQNFTKDARDGNRVSTIANIEKGLEMNFIKTGNYPIPDGEITQLLGTGGTLLSQKGIIGENITRLIKMNTTAIDPLINTNYVYAVNWDQKSYQIGSLQEGNIVSTLPIINQTYASTPYKALVKGTYKPGLVNVGGFTYMLPSLIFNIGETVEGEIEKLPQQNIKKINISTIINPENKIFYVVNKDNNLPYQINNQTQINQKQTLELEYMQELKKKILENINKNKPAGQEITSEVLKTNLQELIVGIQSTQNILSQEITQTIQKITNTTTQTSTTQGTPSNCQPETIEDYNVGQTNNGSNFNAEKIVNISNGTLTYKQTFTCNNGTPEKTGTEEILTPNCNTNYIPSGNTCVLDSCTGTPPDKSELNGTQGTATWEWSQTEQGVCKYKCIDGYETASCTPKTKEVTSATHNSRNYTFTSFTLVYNTPQTKTSQTLNIPNGTATLTAKFTLETDGTTVNLSEQNEVVTCNANYTLTSGVCQANTRTNQACTGKPANSVYNTATTIIQTWNGTTWTPSTTAVWNTTASITECRFTCNAGFTYQSGACNKIIPTGTFTQLCSSSGEIFYTDVNGNFLAEVDKNGDTVLGNPGLLDINGHIVICTGNNTGHIIRSRNNGATAVGYHNTNINSYGRFYQRGNNWGQYYNEKTTTTTKPNCNLTSPMNYSYFVIQPSVGSNSQWCNNIPTSPWGGPWFDSQPLLSNYSGMQGPCESGYHIPSLYEMSQVINLWEGTTVGDAISKALRIPYAGMKWHHTADHELWGGYYWLSGNIQDSSGRGFALTFTSTRIDRGSYNMIHDRKRGYTIRCFKNP